MQDQKICVVGLGGVGGILGVMLASHQEHVSFYARGKRLESILANGLKLKSAAYGEITAYPEKAGSNVEELGLMDYIFLAVKNFSLEEVCSQIAPMVDEKTIVVPLLNGIDVSERVRAALGKGIVLDGLVYVTSGTDRDFTIEHSSPYFKVHIGFGKGIPVNERALNGVKALLDSSGLECSIEPDIEAAIWKKYILNCGYNVVTAYYNATTKDLRENPKAIEQLRTLLEEASLLARTLGVNIPQDLEDTHMSHILKDQASAATSSLKRDMEEGRENELDVFSGKLLRLANQYGVKIPLTEKFYEELKKKSPGSDR